MKEEALDLNRMTAEQILEKHLLLMLKRTDQSYVSVDEMKEQPEWQATINAMLEYGEMQALCKPAVEGRNEQLPSNSIIDKEHKKLLKAFYPKDKSKRFRR